MLVSDQRRAANRNANTPTASKKMPIINTSYCRVEILTLHFEIFGSFYQASSLHTAPNVQVQTESLGWWFYGQLMPRTYARFVHKKK